MRAPTRKLHRHRRAVLSVVTVGAMVTSALLGVAAAPAAATGALPYHLPTSPLSDGLLMARAIHAGVISIRGGHPSDVSQGSPLLTTGADAEASGPGSQPANSAAIAASPTVRGLLLSASSDYNCSTFSGFYVSKDNGATWPNRACMPAVSGFSGGGLPDVAWDRLGNAYGTGVESASSCCSTSVYITRSTNEGVTWKTPVLAQPPVFPSGLVDVPRLQADVTSTSPHVNCLYVSATQFDASFNDSQIDVSHSCDRGATWSAAVAVSPVCSVSSCVSQFSAMAIDKAGNVDVTWLTCATTGDCGGSFGTVFMARSTDGGLTWGAPIGVGSDILAPDTCGGFYGCLPNTNERIGDTPQVDVVTSGPHAGRMYVVDYTWTGSVMQVEVRHSNTGKYWSAPVAVTPPQSQDQFFPWLAVDHRSCSASCGEVGVSWLDRKNDPSNISYQAFATVSSGGITFSAPRLISTGGLESPLNDGLGGRYMGVYSGACWSYKKIGTTIVSYYHAAWTDTRSGSAAQAWVGGLSIP